MLVISFVLCLDGETMYCWKTINLSRDIGLHRILFISMITMILVFILTYLPINLLFPKIHFDDGHFLLFMFILVCMMPVHKLLHVFPLILTGCRVSFNIKFYRVFPTFQLKACEGIKKKRMIISLLTPFLTFSILFVIGGIYFPAYIHYLSIAFAFHIGMCVPDFLLLRQLLFAPKVCTIEEYEDGYEVLVQNNR